VEVDGPAEEDWPCRLGAENQAGGWVFPERNWELTSMADTTVDGADFGVGKTILLIDDDPEILASMRTVLETRGYRTVTANDGNSGLAAAERESPDLIVVDMMMPKKSGFLVVEKVKRRPNAPPMIMITANEGSRHRAYAELLGIDAYLRKPFAMERLVEEVQRLT
jgi:DNA-binding response OmpR family regulator